MVGFTTPETWQDPILHPCSPPSLFCPAPERGLSGRGRAGSNSEHSGCQRKEALLLLRRMPLTSDCQSVPKQECLRGNVVHILGSLRRHCNFLAPWWLQEWGLWPQLWPWNFFILLVFTHYQCIVRLVTTAGSGTCCHPETVFREVFWPSSENYL